MKKIVFPTIAAFATAIFFLAFAPNPTPGMSMKDTPGTIQAIGNAGSNYFFTFEKWQFTKVEMQEGMVEKIKLEAEIDCRSISGPRKDLVKSVKKKKDYFNVSDFPTAKVIVNGAEDQGDGSWITNAEVTIKEFTKTVPLTFTISDEKPYHVEGTGEIQRQEFGFTGSGPKDEVPVSFDAILPLD